MAATRTAAHDERLAVADGLGHAGEQEPDVQARHGGPTGQSVARSVTVTDCITSPTWVAWATSRPSVT